MGDGCVRRYGDGNERPFVQVTNTSEKYLQHLSSEVFPVLSTEPTLFKTAEEAAKDARKSGFRTDAEASNYSTQYQWWTKSHPEIRTYGSWYSSGSKVFPESIKLTPTTLKHWFVGDGTFYNKGTRKRVTIALNNERENRQKIENMFEWAGFEDFTWTRCDNQSGHGGQAAMNLNKKGTKWFFRYIGDPLPGFERKWPDDRSELGLQR